MRNVLCWAPERVTTVINIEADSMPASVFWAVDSETPVFCAEREHGVPVEINTTDLIARFLDPRRYHMQMAVLGPSGVGKSHLIRRLQHRLEGQAGLEVLTIQRLETNLRAILEKLIKRLPIADRTQFQQDLESAGHTLTSPASQRNALLDGLAQALEDDTVRPESLLEEDVEVFLLENLPKLLRDPYLREKKFLQQDEIIHELVDRLLTNREGKRADERLLFQKDNLPLSGIRLDECSAPARDAVAFYLFDADNAVPQVLEVINRNLDRAIARTLNFSGERLVELMGTLRRRLNADGKQLVLLFEEFARLQGYDGAMLEALMEQGAMDVEGGLCNVRWAIACTSGRFRELPDTVRGRMDLIVDMEASPPRFDLTSFAGRYLNAVRLGRDKLDNAWNGGDGVPNACEACQFRPSCFDAFGHSEGGHGLYPFTARAIRTMAIRADREVDTRFNPRVFQANVLRRMLADEGPRLADDAFPAASLLEKFGGAVITAPDRERLYEKAGARFDRYLSLFQLWSDGRLENPPTGVPEAFGMEPLPGLSASVEPEIPPGEVRTPPVPPLPPPVNPQLAQLGAWGASAGLDQTLTGKLRTWLFPLIEQAIDWDAAQLLPLTFAGATAGAKPFRNQSIHFTGQATAGGVATPIRLELPLRRDNVAYAATARALEALLQYNDGGAWVAAGGLDGMAALRELVDECAQEVLAQMRLLRTAGTPWDPVAAAIELLLVGGALGGALSGPVADERLVDAVFAPMQDENAVSEGPLKATYERLKRKREDLAMLVRSHASGSKGGRAGRFINPALVLATARRLRRGKWILSASPAKLESPYAEIGEIYERVARDLGPGLAEERRRRSEWLQEVETAFGGEENRQRIIDAVTAVLDATARAGLPTRRRALDAALGSFATVQFGAAVAAARTIRAADPPESELPAFARGRDTAIGASRDLIKAWRDFITEAGAEVRVRQEEQGVTALQDQLKRLDDALGELSAELEGLEVNLVTP